MKWQQQEKKKKKEGGREREADRVGERGAASEVDSEAA